MRSLVIVLLLASVLSASPSPSASPSTSPSASPSTTGRAFGRSLLVPGWGHLSEGRRAAGYAFLTAEVLLVSSLVSFVVTGNWLEQDYKALADQYAGITGGHDHQFYVDIGNWNDRRSYNEQRLRDRDYDAVYWNDGDDWGWDFDGNRQHFKSVRIASDRAKQRALMVVGGMVLNRLAAAIDATRKTGRRVSVSFDYPFHGCSPQRHGDTENSTLCASVSLWLDFIRR